MPAHLRRCPWAARVQESNGPGRPCGGAIKRARGPQEQTSAGRPLHGGPHGRSDEQRLCSLGSRAPLGTSSSPPAALPSGVSLFSLSGFLAGESQALRSFFRPSAHQLLVVWGQEHGAQLASTALRGPLGLSLPRFPTCMVSGLLRT